MCCDLSPLKDAFLNLADISLEVEDLNFRENLLDYNTMSRIQTYKTCVEVFCLFGNDYRHVRSSKNSRKVSYTMNPDSPNGNLLYNHST